MEPGPIRRRITAALLLGISLAALEGSAVAAAMPTVIGDLGGMARLSWVFSAYLLTSTATVPLFGKLVDLVGRGKVYYFAAATFLFGSALCGVAQTLDQLIVFRAIQGLGAGGLFPASVTLIGDLYKLEERGKVQGLFAANWAVSSLLGPAIGGLVTDALSWRWVFYLNLPAGLASIILLAIYLREPKRSVSRRDLDVAGSVLVFCGTALLLVGLLEGGQWGWSSPATLAAFVLAGLALVGFWLQERRAADPVMPLDLFANRVIAVSAVQSAVLGGIVFLASAFVPILGQGVLGGTALSAGMLLAPISLGWPIASTLAGRLLMAVGYRRLMIVGSVLSFVSAAVIAGVIAEPPVERTLVLLTMFGLGFGLGLVSTPQLVAVQTAVPWERRGVATSSLQFFRSIGGALAVSVGGALLAARLTGELGAHADALLAPARRGALAPELVQRLSSGLLLGLGPVFLGLAGLAGVLVLVGWAFPPGSAQDHAHAEPESGS